MKKISFHLLLALLLLACRVSSTPASTPRPNIPASATDTLEPTPTESAPAPDPIVPIVPADSLSVQDPMVSDPNAGQAKFRLMELGYDICTITADFYTYQTAAAVGEFQAAAGLDANGALDPVTLERLLSPDAPANPAADQMAVPASIDTQLTLQAGDAFAAAGDSFWILQGGYFVQFSITGDFLGFYMVASLPGEEAYIPAAVAYDGTRLWIAQQGPSDAIVQAYDPAAASPTEGLLQPALPASIHFNSLQTHPAAAFDGQTVWFLADDQQNLSLQPVNVDSATAGTPLRVGQSSGFGFGYGLAADPASGLLWLSYGDEIFGEQAIVRVDPAAGNVGPALGPCGAKAAYAYSRLWFINQQGLWSIDPGSGESILYDVIPGEQAFFAVSGNDLWLLDSGGNLSLLAAP